VPHGRISKRSVDALVCPPSKDREILWDETLTGFGVTAFPTGRKVYVVQYRQHGRSRRVSIGEHGRLTADEGRCRAKTILGQVAQGADPIAERRKARAVRTFGEIAADFVIIHVAAKRKGRTGKSYESLLRNHILPAIGSKRVEDVRRADVAHLHSSMKHTPGAANRTLSVVSAIWNWAARREEVRTEDNPAKGVERYREQGKERFLTSEELTRLGDALVEGETIGLPWDADEEAPNGKHLARIENRRTRTDPFAVAAIRLLIFTGARLSEIVKLKWESIDFERGMIFLPDSKTGRKPVYLSAPALAILSGLPRVEGTPYVVAGAKAGKPRADLNKPWRATSFR
jgi:integrase